MNGRSVNHKLLITVGKRELKAYDTNYNRSRIRKDSPSFLVCHNSMRSLKEMLSGLLSGYTKDTKFKLISHNITIEKLL